MDTNRYEIQKCRWTPKKMEQNFASSGNANISLNYYDYIYEDSFISQKHPFKVDSS